MSNLSKTTKIYNLKFSNYQDLYFDNKKKLILYLKEELKQNYKGYNLANTKSLEFWISNPYQEDARGSFVNSQEGLDIKFDINIIKINPKND